MMTRIFLRDIGVMIITVVLVAIALFPQLIAASLVDLSPAVEGLMIIGLLSALIMVISRRVAKSIGIRCPDCGELLSVYHSDKEARVRLYRDRQCPGCRRVIYQAF